MAKKVRVWELADRLKVVGGLRDMGRVPKDDGGDDQIERGGATLLPSSSPIVNMALGVREDSAGEGVSCLAFAKPGLASLSEFGIFEPVEHEQRTLDSADFTEGEMKPVLPPIGAEFAQHIGGSHGAGLDRRDKAEDIIPVLDDDPGCGKTRFWLQVLGSA